jgi:hypothetical protein
MAKLGYFEKLKRGTAHKKYDPTVEGYGNEAEWCEQFNATMGFGEATSFRDDQRKKGRMKRSELQIIGDLAGVTINQSSMWNDIKSAFRKATMNCHPDRTVAHGKPVDQAQEEFKELTAAFTILKHQHGEI